VVRGVEEVKPPFDSKGWVLYVWHTQAELASSPPWGGAVRENRVLPSLTSGKLTESPWNHFPLALGFFLLFSLFSFCWRKCHLLF
jgi:hypothetical protein